MQLSHTFGFELRGLLIALQTVASRLRQLMHYTPLPSLFHHPLLCKAVSLRLENDELTEKVAELEAAGN